MATATVDPLEQFMDPDDDGPIDVSDLRNLQVQLIRRINKDALDKIGESPENMSKDEIRFLVSSY